MTINPELIGTANLKNRSRKHLAKSPKLVIESLLVSNDNLADMPILLAAIEGKLSPMHRLLALCIVLLSE